MICPNANGSESPTYAEHMDRVNLEQRLRVLTNREERARMARAAEEQDIGCVTLWMPKRDLQTRLLEALAVGGRLTIGRPRRWVGGGVNLQNIPRAPRNEREFNLQWRAQL